MTPAEGTAADAGGPAGDPDDVPVDGPTTVAEKRLLAGLARQARAVNLARVLRLLELLDAADVGVLDDEGRREAENLAHQVVGSAGTFGLPAASVMAVGVEDFFATHVVGDAGGTWGVRQILGRLQVAFGS